MNFLTFFEAVFYVLDKLTFMFLAFVMIYFSLKFGTESRLQTAVATLLVVTLSIFFVFTPFIQLVYYFVTSEPL
ncbi:MAG TPA: hypothetical protein H9733_05040 [Candidatus Anaerotignum merdipullorum]|nr:hypothetical protein [Candidatus Anaerotignum merdipullorum]